MVIGTSPASSEIQKRIRNVINNCPNAVNIKDDIIVHGKGKSHDEHLKKVFHSLHDNGFTLRLQKCILGQAQVKWCGHIYSKDGMSPDPDKCKIIRDHDWSKILRTFGA